MQKMFVLKLMTVLCLSLECLGCGSRGIRNQKLTPSEELFVARIDQYLNAALNEAHLLGENPKPSHAIPRYPFPRVGTPSSGNINPLPFEGSIGPSVDNDEDNPKTNTDESKPNLFPRNFGRNNHHQDKFEGNFESRRFPNRKFTNEEKFYDFVDQLLNAALEQTYLLDENAKPSRAIPRNPFPRVGIPLPLDKNPLPFGYLPAKPLNTNHNPKRADETSKPYPIPESLDGNNHLQDKFTPFGFGKYEPTGVGFPAPKERDLVPLRGSGSPIGSTDDNSRTNHGVAKPNTIPDRRHHQDKYTPFGLGKEESIGVNIPAPEEENLVSSRDLSGSPGDGSEDDRITINDKNKPSSVNGQDNYAPFGLRKDEIIDEGTSRISNNKPKTRLNKITSYVDRLLNAALRQVSILAEDRKPIRAIPRDPFPRIGNARSFEEKDDEENNIQDDLSASEVDRTYDNEEGRNRNLKPVY